MVRKNSKFKKGVASFYVVAISTLILVIIAASFAAVIISELARTSNNDLAQSAYDSALAGVEDAKLAYSNYLKCKDSGASASATEPAQGGSLDCGAIMWYAEHPDCDNVAHMLGRLPIGGEGGEVLVEESSSGGNNMQQAYTCAKLDLQVDSVIEILTEENPMKTIKVEPVEGADVSSITQVEVSWHSDEEGAPTQYKNIGDDGVVFPSIADGNGSENIASPPTLEVGLIQTGSSFDLGSFDVTKGEQTNRGTVYLVPTNDESKARSKVSDNYKATVDEPRNFIPKEGLLQSNNKTKQNLPYAVLCGPYFDSCLATIELPEPIGGNRSEDTFVMTVSTPYGRPNVVVELEFYNDDDTDPIAKNVSGGDATMSRTVALKTQVSVDVTGRANDLYRRVTTRLESSGGSSSGATSRAVEVLGNGVSGSSIEKITDVICEVNFDVNNCTQ